MANILALVPMNAANFDSGNADNGDALATVPGVSRSAALGLGDVSEEDVARAREWGEYDALIQRVQAGSAIAIGWLYQQQVAGAAVPEWSAVLERM